MRVDEAHRGGTRDLAISESEARAIFNIADDEAKLVGDDLPARWYALTNTAHRLGTGAEPERGYRLLQIGEVLDADDRLSISQARRAHAAMHSPSYYAAASGQRDRRALSFDWLLTPIMKSASLPDGPIGALAVTALGARGPWESIAARLPVQEAARLDVTYTEFTRHIRRPEDVPRQDSGTGASRTWDSPKKPPKPSKLVQQFDFTTPEGWDGAFAKADWHSDVGGR